jgi:hypothetical protein
MGYPLLMARRNEANLGAIGWDQGATHRFANSTRRLSPHLRMRSRTVPAAVKGAPYFGAAERTLDGEDRSEKVWREGKGGSRDLAESGSFYPAADNPLRTNLGKTLHSNSGQCNVVFHPFSDLSRCQRVQRLNYDWIQSDRVL